MPEFNIAPSSFCAHMYNCGLNNIIVVTYHIRLVLIIAAYRQVTIYVLCSLSGVYRVKVAISAVIKGITTASAYVWIYWGGWRPYRRSITFNRTA